MPLDIITRYYHYIFFGFCFDVHLNDILILVILREICPELFCDKRDPHCEPATEDQRNACEEQTNNELEERNRDSEKFRKLRNITYIHYSFRCIFIWMICPNNRIFT